jgi:hypothetical protein
VVATAWVCPAAENADPPRVPGFACSAFSPLVREAARRCLGDPGTPDAPNPLIARHEDTTAVVLATVAGDATTSDLASQNLLRGRVHNPLLFFQSVTTSILGYLTAEYGLTGPVSCLAADSGISEAALDAAALLLTDDDLDQVLLIGVELAGTERTRAAFEHLAAAGAAAGPPAADLAVALLLRRPTGDETAAPLGDAAARSPSGAAAHLGALAELARAYGSGPDDPRGETAGCEGTDRPRGGEV